MKTWKLASLTVAILAAFPAVSFAQSNAEVLTELRALRERVADTKRSCRRPRRPSPLALLLEAKGA